MIITRPLRLFFTKVHILPSSSFVSFQYTYDRLSWVSLTRFITFSMASNKLSYEDAVHKLNTLQSNKSTLQQIRRDLKSGKKCTNLEDMENYLHRTGITLSMLDQLSVIHVAGTKGKGSTSAMCESILRAHGFRTGFYSSPHLVAVRERVRLGGQPMSEQAFAEHFDRVYNALYDTQAFDGDMPKYFGFLTVLAFNVFLKEKVDVAVVEVGIGGIVDYTNILREVPVVGITSLGFDHTSILGNTLAEIASAKAGIMKPNCEAYTVEQPVEAMDVLRKIADSVKCPLRVVPEYSTYSFDNSNKYNIPLAAYKMNASLAIQLAHAWMRVVRKNIRSYKRQVSGKVLTNGYTDIDPLIIDNDKSMIVNTLTNETVLGLKECKWPGRYHVIQRDHVQYYLDGAHTKESIEICAAWYDKNNRYRDKILIFSATGDRDAEVLLRVLMKINFKRAYFVIPAAHKRTSKQHDNYSILESDELLLRCKNYASLWNNNNKNITTSYVMECVSDALLHINKESAGVCVLVTGSLHLVGAALSLIEPQLCTNGSKS